MSSRLEHSDSDSNSWILLDDKEKSEDEEEEEEEEIAPRKTVQDIHEFEDSDGISIISDPEDYHTETNESTTETVETKKQEEEIESTKGKELVSLESKPVKTSGSVTSALFMIAGLLIALYFQTGCEDETTSTAKTQYTSTKTNNLIYETSKFKQINNEDYIYSSGKGIDNRKLENEAIFKKPNKGYERKPRYEENVKYEKGIKDKYFKKHKNYDSSEERKYKKKYYGSHENDYKYNKDREEYLMKKQQYLKHKEDKLKQKELKIHSKNSREYRMEDKHQYRRDKYINYDHSMSGEWYGKMHKGRDEIRSSERRSEWVFDRAQMRDKKRDKAHWYFNWMDDREDVRFRG